MSGLDDLFIEGQEADMSLEEISNKFNLDFSFNFVFDDTSKFDAGGTDSNVTASEGKLQLSTGSSGVFISVAKSMSFDITKVHVLAAGEDLGNAQFSISADNGNNWKLVTLDELVTLSVSGRNLRLRISLNANTARVDSCVVLFS